MFLLKFIRWTQETVNANETSGEILRDGTSYVQNRTLDWTFSELDPTTGAENALDYNAAQKVRQSERCFSRTGNILTTSVSAFQEIFRTIIFFLRNFLNKRNRLWREIGLLKRQTTMLNKYKIKQTYLNEFDYRILGKSIYLNLLIYSLWKSSRTRKII